jgi:predicted DNA-binding transcriptional regulator YafY
VMRGYAWAGTTLWNQGMETRAEREFGLKCFQYFESPDQTFEESEIAATNVEKVSSLASRWSLDPASVDENLFEHAYGIAGEPPRLY